MNLASRLNNQGASLLASGSPAISIPHLERALALDPGNLGTKVNLACALREVGKFQASAQQLAEVLTEDPRCQNAWKALGMLYMALGNYEQALGHLEHALSLGEAPQIRFERTCCLLALGKWKEGWKDYELRLRYNPERRFVLPQWDGVTREGHVYCWAEQGYGDTIQFSRWVSWLASRVEHVTFALPADLLELFSGYEEIADLVVLGEPPEECTSQVALLSLPYFSGCEVDSVPLDTILRPSTHDWVPERKRVGLCWSGSSQFARAHQKAIPFELLASLCADPNVDYYSLQVGSRSQDIATHGAQMLLEDRSKYLLGNWVATAQEIKSSSLVVTVDTAVAHLAGCLGVPVWLLLGRVDTWRWLTSREDSPFYPSMRIFRQPTQGDWASVIAQVKTELASFLVPPLPPG